MVLAFILDLNQTAAQLSAQPADHLVILKQVVYNMPTDTLKALGPSAGVYVGTVEDHIQGVKVTCRGPTELVVSIYKPINIKQGLFEV